MDSKYFLLFKTAQAEFRAWNELTTDVKRHILPIIELTRGRKIPGAGKNIDEKKWPSSPGIYDFSGALRKTRESFKGNVPIIIDLTREEALSCAEIDELFDSKDGYSNWLNFLESENKEFDSLIPTMLISPKEGETDEEYKDNISKQLDGLMQNFSAVAYRASVLIDPDFLYDLALLKDKINSYLDAGKHFLIELDHEFIRPGTGILHAIRTLEIIEKINNLLPLASIVILSTSFPRNIDELGDPDHGIFAIEEVFLFEEIKKNNKKKIPLLYGDYGSINPLRNDLAFSRGWRPRIDFPTSKKKTYYYREKRETIKKEGNKSVYSTYKSHYISVAINVVKDNLFEDVQESWGVKQIKFAAKGAPPGEAPSFWISVRMEIYIRQQIKRLGLSE